MVRAWNSEAYTTDIKLAVRTRAGSVVPEMISRLNWAMPVALREVIEDGSNHFSTSDYGGFQHSSQFIRLFSRRGGSPCGSTRERRQSAPTGGVRKHLQSKGVLREAIVSLICLLHQGVSINSYDYTDILQACFKHKDLESLKEVHDCIKKSGLEENPFVANNLLRCYIRCGRLQIAHELFNKFVNKDAVSWTLMIRGYAESDQIEDAFQVYQQMRNEGGQPDAVTYLTVLEACASPLALKRGKDIHAHIVHNGFQADLRVCNALVHMYGNCGSVYYAKMVFDNMVVRDVISWNAMIGVLAQHGRGHEALSVFHQMQREGWRPNAITYLNILNPCLSTGSLEWVKEVHAHASKVGLDFDVRVGNALVHMYAKSGSIADAKLVFDSMINRDVISWNAMIGGLAQHGHGREALELFEEMMSKGVKPDQPTLLAVLSACSHAGLVDEGRFQFMSMTRDKGIEPELEPCTCMLDILGRAGHLEEAYQFISKMPIKPNDITWKALLGACKVYNKVKLAEVAAKECLKLAPTDPAPYVTLSNIYAAVGDWDQASSIRSMIEEKGMRKDPGLCWVEVDNKVHHFSVGDTSHPETREIYATLNGLVKRMKAEGYIPDTRLALRNIGDEDKESSVCSHSEKLALAYGLMHVTPGKTIRIYKNLRICSDCHTATKLISKVTGRDIVARDANRFHHFNDGSCSCGDYW